MFFVLKKSEWNFRIFVNIHVEKFFDHFTTMYVGVRVFVHFTLVSIGVRVKVIEKV